MAINFGVKSMKITHSNGRDFVEEKGEFWSQGLPEGNERRRFHGTRRDCYVVDRGNTAICASSRCSLCSILKYGFDLDRAGEAKGFLRHDMLFFKQICHYI
jgi:hypothetical protein